MLSKDEESVAPYKRKIMAALDGTAGSIFMAVVTMWALFGDDIRLCGTYVDADPGFLWMTYFCLICFATELMLAVRAVQVEHIGLTPRVLKARLCFIKLSRHWFQM